MLRRQASSLHWETPITLVLLVFSPVQDAKATSMNRKTIEKYLFMVLVGLSERSTLNSDSKVMKFLVVVDLKSYYYNTNKQ
jgi:hypothetical protein